MSDKRLDNIQNIVDSVVKDVFDQLRASIKTCVHCTKFNEKTELCSEPRNLPTPQPLRPPARIIAFGCDYFEDKVPF